MFQRGLLIAACLLFLMDALGVPSRVRLLSLGLAFWVLWVLL